MCMCVCMYMYAYVYITVCGCMNNRVCVCAYMKGEEEVCLNSIILCVSTVCMAFVMILTLGDQAVMCT